VVLLQIKLSANSVSVAIGSAILVITGVMQPRGGAKNRHALTVNTNVMLMSAMFVLMANGSLKKLVGMGVMRTRESAI
jgi:hypothetical protein